MQLFNCFDMQKDKLNDYESFIINNYQKIEI